MAKITEKFEVNSIEQTLTFGALTAGFMKENRELLKTCVVKSDLDSLIEQIPVVAESLKRGATDTPAAIANDLGIDDLYRAIRLSMEASGFKYEPVGVAKPGEGKPAGA